VSELLVKCFAIGNSFVLSCLHSSAFPLYPDRLASLWDISLTI
jgi:hypothetical protein